MHAQSCLTVRPHGLQPARLLCPRDFSGKSTAVGRHFLLQGIFLTQGWNSPFCGSCTTCGFYTAATSGKRSLALIGVLGHI